MMIFASMFQVSILNYFRMFRSPNNNGRHAWMRTYNPSNEMQVKTFSRMKYLEHIVDWLCRGFNDTSTLWVILYRLPEKGREEIEEIVEDMKERDREERGSGMKVKKQKK